MADYYPLLAKAIAGLPESTAEARQAVYDRARKALFGQLRNLDPPVPEDAIDREAQALERAVARIETEITSRSGPESSVSTAGFGSRAAPTPADEPSAAPLPLPESPVFYPPRVALLDQTPVSPPPLKVRRDPPSTRPGVPPDGSPQQSPAPDNNTRRVPPGARNGAPAVLPAAMPPAAQGGSQGPAATDAAAGQNTSFGEGFYPIAPESSGQEGPWETPSFATPDGAPNQSADDFEPAARTRIEARRPFAPHLEGETGTAKRVGIVASIIGLVVALVAIAAYQLRDRPEDLVRLQPPAASIPGEAGAGGKIVDRIVAGAATPGATGPSSTAGRGDVGKSGSEPANPPIPVARRAALLVEAPEEQSKVKALLGTVVWRVENVSNGPDEPLSTAVRAEIEIPEAELRAAMAIQKNFDSTLPASHTMKLRFSVRPDSPLANLKQISVLLRREDTPTGDALKGITVPVTENSFLIGLSRGDGEAANLDLLRSREWFDIPMVLANGHIAKLTFEKGPSGRSALDDGMASWQAKK